MTYEELIAQGEKGVIYLTPAHTDFEATYLDIRSREQRLPEDELVRKLPYLPSTHPLFREWRQRAGTLRRFRRFLQRGPRRRILEIGCGNGWFSAQIAPFSSHTIGLDVGATELEQAFRCFSSAQLTFVCCTDLYLLPPGSFDLLVFNASIQYFDVHPDFWQHLFSLLRPHGEIHLLDSPIYAQKELDAARLRSAEYYTSMGNPQALDFYHHISWNHLPAGYQIAHRPGKLQLKLRKQLTPFPWIRIYKPA